MTPFDYSDYLIVTLVLRLDRSLNPLLFTTTIREVETKET